jgi:hypothetical protein
MSHRVLDDVCRGSVSQAVPIAALLRGLVGINLRLGPGFDQAVCDGDRCRNAQMCMFAPQRRWHLGATEPSGHPSSLRCSDPLNLPLPRLSCSGTGGLGGMERPLAE